MLPFKDGAFSLAIEYQVPIVPVTFIDNWKVFYKSDGKEFATPGFVRAVVHEPIETTGLTKNDVPMLREKVFNIINFALNTETYESKQTTG